VIAADLLRQDSQWLEQMRAAHCSGLVEYRKPLEAWTVQATFGKTGFEGTAQVWDFLIHSDALPGGELEPGDAIAANGRRYEVVNLGGEGCWRLTAFLPSLIHCSAVPRRL